MRQGCILVLSAPSGAGKTTLAKMLLSEFPNLGFSVSCTTRPPRQGEEDGRDYFFISREEFEKKRNEGDFAEWAQVHGNLYGTLLSSISSCAEAGRDILMDVDVQGAMQLRSTLPGAFFVFILPPSMRELKRRLLHRNAEDELVIQRRLGIAKKEIREATWYNAIILNDDIHRAYVDLRASYITATLAPILYRQFINNLLEENIGDANG